MTLISPRTWASGEVRLDITLRGFFGKLRARILLGFCKTSPLIMGNRKVLLPGSFPSTRFSCGQVVFWAFWSRWGIPDSANFQTFFQLVKVGMFVKNTQMWWSVRILFGVWESSLKSFAKFCGGFICHVFFPAQENVTTSFVSGEWRTGGGVRWGEDFRYQRSSHVFEKNNVLGCCVFSFKLKIA